MRRLRQTGVESLACGLVEVEGWSLGSRWKVAHGATLSAPGFSSTVYVTLPRSLLGQEPGCYVWLRKWPLNSDVCV